MRGVWLNMFHVFLADPCFAPSGWGRLLNLVIFGIFVPVQHHCRLVWWCWVVCFWLGFGLFTALFLAETFVESLILAQDER